MYIDQLFSPNPVTEAVRTDLAKSRVMINEALLLEEPGYREWRQIGQQLCELDLSKQQILSLFGNVEQTMTNRDTGANRTMLGRGKDITTKYAGKIADMTSKILSSVQDSVPVEAVDTYYNQATNALNKLVGGDKGKVMKAIMTYRNLAKAYPKTAGFAKAALVAIAGLATGGAGLPVIAGLTYGLDSAIQGDRLSTVLGKGAGAAALAYAGQQVAGALGGGDAAAATTAQQPAGMNLSYDNFVTANPTTTLTPAQFAAQQAAGTLPGQAAAGGVAPELAMGAGQPAPIPAPEYDMGAGQTLPGAEGAASAASEVTRYTVTAADAKGLGSIAQKFNITAQQLWDANPQIADPNKIYVGQELNVPASTGEKVNVWDGWQGPTKKTVTVEPTANTDIPAPPAAGGAEAGPGAADTANTVFGQSTAKPNYTPMAVDLPSDPLIFDPATGRGTVTLPDGETLRARVFPADGMQPRLGSGLETVKVVHNGQELTGYIRDNVVYFLNYPATPAVKESWLPKVKLRRLPAEKLIDQKITVMSWALNESVGKTQGRSVHLTHHGVATVFENVHRVGEAIVKELRGVPGSMPGYLSPDLPGGPGKPVRPGAIGRGLNWLDKKAGQLGGFIKRTGHELTTNVTKDKLQMKWQTAGEPTDSDAVAALLIKSKVPADVVKQVFDQMGIPYTATQAADKVPVGRAFPKIIKPGTTRYYTQKELDALQAGQAPVSAAPAAPTVAAQPTAPAATPAAKPAAKTGTLPGFDYKSVMQMPGMKPAPAKPASFAVPNAYGKTTYSVKPSAAASANPAKAAASLTPNEYIKRLGAPALPESKRFVKSLVSQVREALQNVTCQEDIARVKKLIDRAFINHDLVNENAQALRDSMIREVVTIGAQRRRKAAQR